jgi:hypothetical protein
MMRHILYLVSLLQHETAPLDLNSDGASDEEEDESSDYDDGDEEDYLTDYEGLEVGNRPTKATKTMTGIVPKMPKILIRPLVTSI